MSTWTVETFSINTAMENLVGPRQPDKRKGAARPGAVAWAGRRTTGAEDDPPECARSGREDHASCAPPGARRSRRAEPPTW